MQLRKLKYLGAMLLDMVLADMCKVHNPGTPFIFRDDDWLCTRVEIRNSESASAVVLRRFQLCALMHIKVYLVFELLK